MDDRRHNDEKKVPRSVFLDAARRLPTEYTPVWLMRQAGRYMPEYRDIRQRHSFIEMCKTPELAAEITLQPVRYMEVDAAIIFADIMLPLEGMGIGFTFTDNEGPVINEPVRTHETVRKIKTPPPEESVPYLLESIGLAKRELAGKIPLIGFSGAPFTLASYVIEGGHSRNYENTKKMMFSEPDTWNALMNKLVDVLSGYLAAQVKAGADALQIFDSWVGCLAPRDYETFVLPHSRKLLGNLEGLDVPVIHFGTDTATLLELMRDAGGDVIGVDWRIPLDEAWKKIGHDRAIQGNLDPAVLFAAPRFIEDKVKEILDAAGGRPGHIFNLGHGILPGIPPEKVKAMVDMVHRLSSK